MVRRQAPAGVLHQPTHVAPPLGRGRTRAIAGQHIDGALPAADLRATAAVPLGYLKAARPAYLPGERPGVTLGVTCALRAARASSATDM